jgi:isoleucyl-tRNA synthetase
MTSVALNGVAPYKTVITHGFVVDKDTKKKISKSEQGGYKKPMEADYFVNKYGADIVRLWAASTQFTDDVPFSEENFTRISESYRGFRNVLRILLANLHDFPASEQPQIAQLGPPRPSTDGFSRNCKPSSPNAVPPTRHTISAKYLRR